MIAHTFTRPGALCPFTARTWPVDGGWLENARATTLEHLPVWIAPELWKVELAGGVATPAAQLRAERGRLVERVDAWGRRTAEAFVAGCVGRTIERVELQPDDPTLALLAADARSCGAPDANVCGWLAARAAFVLSGADGYRREREHQSRWLIERLQLRGRPETRAIV
jgi:hypothetical protein